ncbi:MAG: glycosyltransferase family 1 protein, partial [Candidatus Cloacimonadota bacterium]
YPYPSGVTEHVSNLAKTLREKGHTVTVITLHYPGEEIEEGVVRMGRVVFVPMNGTLTTLPLLNPLTVKSFFDKNRFDIVHLNGPFFPNISHWALKYTHYPCIASFHSTGFRNLTFGARYYKRLFPFYNKLKAYIGGSQVSADFIKPYLPGKYQIVPYGVDIERFTPSGKKHPEITKLKGKKVLFLGRLDARKGLRQLLPTFNLIRKEMDAHLIVAGAGPEKPKYEHFVKKNSLTDYVHFLGFIPNEELASVYRSCDIYCSPALGGETFGIVLIEAMASGVPVVASNIDGYKEVIKDGYNGLLFNPHSTEDIKEKILTVLLNDSIRGNLVKEGLRAVKQYDWNCVTERILEIYLKVVRNERHSERMYGMYDV